MSLQVVFDQLRPILAEYAPHMVCTEESVDSYSLDTHHIMKNKKPLFFAAVKVNRQYVSFHLMPVYVQPELLKNISPELKKRMQGKSCFNFRQVDDCLFAELKELARAGYEFYRHQGYV